MGLLTIKNHQLELNPDVLAIPVFKKIWDSDKTEGKHKAYKELLYVYYVADHKSPYSKYPKEERTMKVAMDIMGEKWKCSSDLQKVIDEYVYTQTRNLPSLRLLMSAREAVHELANWLDNVDYEVTEPAKVTRALGDIGKIINSLNALEEKVKKEITTTSRARGGGVEGAYENM